MGWKQESKHLTRHVMKDVICMHVGVGVLWITRSQVSVWNWICA